MAQIVHIPLGGGGGGGGTDRFEASIIIGNVLSGDPAVAQAAPFQYIPDPGDGSGIEAALLLALGNVAPTRIRIRPGTYTLPVGASSFFIPAWVVLEGALPGLEGGGSTTGPAVKILRQVDDPNRQVFEVEGALSDVHVQLAGPTSADTPFGNYVVRLLGPGVVENVSIRVTDDELSQEDDSLNSMFLAVGIGGRVLDCWAQYDPPPSQNTGLPRVAAFVVGLPGDPLIPTQQTIVRGQTSADHFGSQIRVNVAQSVSIEVHGGGAATGQIDGNHVQARLSTAAQTDSSFTPPYQLEIGGSFVILDYTLRDTGADMLGYIECTGEQVSARVTCTGTVSSSGIVDSGSENQWTGCYVDGPVTIDGTLIGFSNGRVTDELTINGDNNIVVGNRIFALTQNSGTSNAAENIVGV